MIKLEKYEAYYNSSDGKYYLKEWTSYKRNKSTVKIEKNQKISSDRIEFLDNREDNIEQDLNDQLVKAIKQFLK